jgi:epoxyqueuosine reductase
MPPDSNRKTPGSIIVLMSLEQEIKDQALALGFDAAGIADAAPLGPEHVEHFEAWLRAGCAGRMHYMQRSLTKRLNPAQLLDGARSVLLVALAYKPREENGEPASPGTPIGKVAQYAQYEDYHPFMKSLLRELAGFLEHAAGQKHEYRIGVDSAPVAEKALAARAGLGFIGRHHLLIHPRLGPQILLGEIITTLGLAPDEPRNGTCRNCHACVKACPAGALREDGLLDARRCISYRTQYESEDDPVRDTAGWVFGCDECLRACPFSHSAPPRANRGFKHYAERACLNLREVRDLTAADFEARFHDSPIRRPGLETLQHNARACLESTSAGRIPRT